ncbi:MAG: hypothetical protein V3U13_01890 [Gemmatimonadota bacterium]
MCHLKSLCTLVLAAVVLAITPPDLFGQNGQQRMNRVMERANQFNQEMARQMQQSQGQYLEQHREMRRVGESMERMAQDMNRLMEHSRSMIQDQKFLRDREMQRDMERLHEHMNGMADQMENTLRVMERLQQRLHQPGGEG